MNPKTLIMQKCFKGLCKRQGGPNSVGYRGGSSKAHQKIARCIAHQRRAKEYPITPRIVGVNLEEKCGPVHLTTIQHARN
ncbi:hypothetical protein CR513_07987, partial [Mucuna pruriens]